MAEILIGSEHETGSDCDLNNPADKDAPFQPNKEPTKLNLEVPALPPEVRFETEIWRQILSYLRDSEAKFLLQLRLVSWQWRALLDEILKENSAPYLINCWGSHQQTGSELWLHPNSKNLVASRFCRPELLEQVLEFPPTTGSPFPTGVVIICPSEELDRSCWDWDFIQNQSLFLERFRNWISTLVYFFRPGESGTWPETFFLNRILKMSSLQRLFLYNQNWNLELDQSRIQLAVTTLKKSGNLPALKQLHLGRDTPQHQNQLRDFLTPIRLFFLFPRVLETVTSLEFDWSYYYPKGPEPDLHCPQLLRLRIGNPTEALLRCFCKPEPVGPQLTHLSIVINQQKGSKTRWALKGPWDLLRGLIPLLDSHSRSLTSFTLEIPGENWRRDLVKRLRGEERTTGSLFQNTGILFPNLTELSLHLGLVLELEWWEQDLKTLFRKFPNVDKVTALGSRRGWSGMRLVERLNSFLVRVVPQTVDGIRLKGYRDQWVTREWEVFLENLE